MTLPVIILGGGGHAKVLIDVLRNQVDIIGITEADPERIGNCLQGVPVIGDDDVVLGYDPKTIRLVNGLGTIGPTLARQQLFEKFKTNGYTFASVIHSKSIVASEVNLAEGVQVMAGVVIQTGSRIGANTIINTSASIDHDCLIGANVHIAPGVTLSGNVEVGDGVHIGTGAVVIQGIKIGNNTLVGAAALINKDVPSNQKVIGVPGKIIGKIY